METVQRRGSRLLEWWVLFLRVSAYTHPSRLHYTLIPHYHQCDDYCYHECSHHTLYYYLYIYHVILHHPHPPPPFPHLVTSPLHWVVVASSLVLLSLLAARTLSLLRRQLSHSQFTVSFVRETCFRWVTIRLAAYIHIGSPFTVTAPKRMDPSWRYYSSRPSYLRSINSSHHHCHRYHCHHWHQHYHHLPASSMLAYVRTILRTELTNTHA